MEKIKHIVKHISIAPFAAFGMILLWAAIFGDTIVFHKNTMIEEWIVSIVLYLLAVILLKLKKKYVSRK
jgi:hypothetical protein